MRVPVPGSFKNKKVDVFTVNLDPDTMKSDVFLEKQVTGEERHLEILPKSTSRPNQYIVIVEPNTTHCIYAGRHVQ